MTKFFLAAFLTFISFIGISQFGNESLITPSLMIPSDAKAFDLDGDGDLDIVASSLFDDKIAWFENLGNGDFSKQRTLSTSANSAKDVYAEDLDMDGDLDILGASSSGVTWFENLGSGHFSAPQTVSSVSGATSVYTSDLDADGDPDVILSAGNNIAWVQNFGGGTFSSTNNLPTTLTSVNMVLAADIDLDGLEDIIACSYGSGNTLGTGKITWHKNLGGGAFAAQQELSSNLYGSTSIHVTDIDNDGDQDVFSSSYYFSNITWYENLGGGVFSSVQVISNSIADAAKSVYSGDVNGDGLDDVITASTDDDRVGWYKNLGAGTFDTLVIISTAGDGPQSVFCDDINADGNLDILVASYFDDKISCFENLGLAVFGPEIVIGITTNAPYALDSRDMDGDGDLDILSHSTATNSAVSSPDASDSSKIVLFENVGGQFGKQQTIDVDLAFPKSIVTEDLDGDGDYEVIVATWNTDKIVWYDNLGGLNFGPQQMISTAVSDPESVFAIDLDGDGDIDILSASKNDDKIAWYENLGSGSFGTQQIISTNANGASFVIAADLDNDGDNDVISASNLDSKVAWYENDGSGVFGPEQIVATNTGGTKCIDAVDLNGDGFLDLVSASSVHNEVEWYENLGGVAFGTEQVISNAVIGAFSISSGDMDGDGDMDLVSAASNSDQVFWHENLGAGLSWADYVLTSDADNVRSVRVTDINQDGAKDILTASISDAKITTYESYFNSTYQLKGEFFYDANQNAIKDTLEGALSFLGTSIQGTFLNNYSSVTGDYFYALDTGAYTVNYSVPTAFWGLTTDSVSYTRTLSVTNPVEDSLDFGFFPDSIVTDISANITGGFPRCNQDVNYWLSISNVGTSLPSGIVHLQLDNALTFVSSVVPPDSIVGQNIYWHYDSLFYYSSEDFNIEVGMPNFMALGLGLNSILTVHELDSTGTTIYSNSTNLTQTVVCAYDPNDKTVEPAGVGPEGYITPDQELEYLIRFQNTGNDTALNVLIIDDLHPNLDWGTFQFISSSHAVQISFNNGQIEFYHEDIFLPDSNVNFLGSQGFVKFSIRPLTGIVNSSEIENTAEIYFDYNPAIITNTVLNTIYYCDSLSLDLNTTNVCFNEELLLNSSPPLAEYYTWQIDSFYSDSSSLFSWQADTSGVFQLSLSATDPICVTDTVVNISVFAAVQLTPVNQHICQGDSVLIYGEYQSIADTYFDTIQNVNGCDSIIESITLNLALPTSTSETQNICQGDSILIHGQYQSAAGTYLDTVQSVFGCDSALSFQLIVDPVNLFTETITICQGDSALIFNTYEFLPGIYQDTTIASTGCDEIYVTTLNVINTAYSQNYTLCYGESILVNGNNLSSSGIYTDTLQTVSGCDSIVTTEIIVNPAIDLTVVDMSPTLEATSNAGTYQWVDCSNGFSIIAGESSQTFTAQQNGEYAVIISENGCTDTSSCFLIENVQLQELQAFQDLMIYPNPNAGVVYLEFKTVQHFDIRIHDLNGKIVLEEQNLLAQEYQFEMNADSGVYFIEVLIDGFSKTYKLVKK
ncbi:MAG: T9SS type A sorting domain-containing protein [Crocinitomicaceae bacterium]